MIVRSWAALHKLPSLPDITLNKDMRGLYVVPSLFIGLSRMVLALPQR